MQDLTTWTQSRFFSPSFNSAIFDGPLRIYFAQIHESFALKICFGMQQQFEKLLARAKKNSRLKGRNICILLYPNEETFRLSFEKENEFIVHDRLGDNAVLALRGPFSEDSLSIILQAIATQLNSWESEISEPAEMFASL